MSQGNLPYQYEEEKTKTGMTSLAGLPLYLDLARAMGLSESLGRHLHVRGEESQGWSDAQVVTALMLLNLAGGDCVEDLRVLENDEGFCEVMRRVETAGMPRKERRALERRWRKERSRCVPSSSSVFRYLCAFHDEEQEKHRETGKAFIPSPNESLRGLGKVNGDFIEFIQSRNRQETATLDMDATLVETSKNKALFSYKGFKSYQPLNTWWAEQGLILHTEFRDGNVPAGFEQLRVFEEALSCLPTGVGQVRLRSDTAGYQHNLLSYCAEGKNRRFGRVEFAVGCPASTQFKQSVLEVGREEWSPIYKQMGKQKVKTEQEWAEVCFVPNAIGHSKEGPEYRYIAIRECLKQKELPGMAEEQASFPFPTLDMDGNRHKVFGVVTNMDWDGGDLIAWQRLRCGKSEEVHAVMKADLAGGKLPSGDFGENAAWWQIMVLALNLNTVMKRFALGGGWVSRRMKAIRFSLINLPGRVVEHSRQLFIRLASGHPSLELLLSARQKIAGLALAPPG